MWTSETVTCKSVGLVIVLWELSCSAARGIFPDQGLNLCSLHWQADSFPLYHLGSLPCPHVKNLATVTSLCLDFSSGSVS